LRTIYKYPLQVIDEQAIKIHGGSKILTVQVQAGIPCLWVEVETTNTMSSRRIFVHGTGHTVHEDAEDYIGSFQLMNGSLVFHVYSE